MGARGYLREILGSKTTPARRLLVWPRFLGPRNTLIVRPTLVEACLQNTAEEATREERKEIGEIGKEEKREIGLVHLILLVGKLECVR